MFTFNLYPLEFFKNIAATLYDFVYSMSYIMFTPLNQLTAESYTNVFTGEIKTMATVDVPAMNAFLNLFGLPKDLSLFVIFFTVLISIVLIARIVYLFTP